MQPQPIVVGLADTLIRHAETAPTVVFAILAIIVPLLVLGGIAVLIVKWLLPAWREEGKLNRQHLADLVAQRGREANEDLAAANLLAKSQHEAIVDRVETKLDQVTSTLDRHTDTLTKIAAKLLVPALLLMLACGAIACLGVVTLAQKIKEAKSEEQQTANECPKGCPAGYHCCGANKPCCEDKTAKAIKHSAEAWLSYAKYAQPSCSARFDADCVR